MKNYTKTMTDRAWV